MGEAENVSQSVRRRWYRTIAGKLLTAFALIAVLTGAATLLALVQFQNIESVLTRLTGSSLPAVKYSLAVETNARAIAAGGAQLSAARSETEHFERLAETSERIGNLWSALSALRVAAPDEGAVSALQSLIAAIDERLGQLGRAVQERIVLAAIRARALDRLNAESTVLTERLSMFSATLESGQTASSANTLRTLFALRADAAAAAALLHQAASADESAEIEAMRTAFEAAAARLRDGAGALQADAAAPPAPAAEIGRAVQAIVAIGTGKDGIVPVSMDALARQREAETLQAGLQQAATDMETQVTALVARAETEASHATAASASALDNSRFWLIAISLLSLTAAILIVWLFVFRYIVARLRELTGGMVAVAGGALDAPIPAASDDELGDMSRALAVFRDNAREIHHARDQAEQARHVAEEASRTKSSFLANMSHELRTPLNAIIGYSELLLEDAIDRGDKASEADLGKIQSAGRHLLGLINDILDLSKIESGRMDIHLEDVDVGKLVAEVRMLVAPLMDRNANALDIALPGDVGVMHTDMVKLKQSLINLLSNAAKFTEKGKVALQVSRQTGPEGPQVMFRVTDSGIGMTQEQLGRLFQAFTQADAATTRNYGGTGLGLTITKHFCTMLGGSIDVSSRPGEGSAFTLTLPDRAAHQRAAVAAQAAGPAESGSATGRTVLVVDDDPAVHDVLRLTLAKEGYRLLHAYDGAEALELARDKAPDAITLDVMMPKLDGWTVLGRLKSDPALAHIPVIMLTIVDERTMGYSLGAAEYMTKPVDRARLVELLRRFAGHSQQGVVLVVDDDPDVRRLVRSTIEKAGLGAAEAGNGGEALEWLARHAPPALILLDLMMPVMDGFEFLDRAKDMKELQRVPVVVLTAKELSEAERRIVNQRTMLVLTKGAQPLTTLGAALSGIARQTMAGKLEPVRPGGE